MKKIPFVEEVKGTALLHYKRTIPADVRHAFEGKTRWSVALKTANREEAARKARALAVEHDRMIERARAPNPLESLTPKQREMIDAIGGVEAYVRRLDEEALEATRLKEEGEFFAPAPPGLADDPFYMAARDMIVGMETDPLSTRKRAAMIQAEVGEIENIISGEARLIRHVEPALAQSLDKAAPALVAALGSVRAVPPSRASVTVLSDALAAWISVKQPRAPGNYQHPVNQFEELHGALPLREITRDHVRAYRDGLANDTGLRESTAQRHFRNVGTILAFAVSEGYLDSSPAAGIRWHKQPQKAVDAASAGRRPISPDEVKRVLKVTDKLIAGGLKRGGREREKDQETAWFLRMLIYTGARGEELAQLSDSDVRPVKGIHSIWINDAGEGQLKNRSALREVPVHKALIDMGFLDWTRRRKGRLFASLKPSGHGRLYASMQSRLKRLLRGHAKIDDARVTPHSFRHAFADACRIANVPEHVTRALMGHADKGNRVADAYGEGRSQIAVMAEWLEKVDPMDERRTVSAFSEVGEGE